MSSLTASGKHGEVLPRTRPRKAAKADMRFIVLGDIHSNALALEAALDRAREIGFDQLVLLGDLFTYGVEPRAVFELVREAQERDGALLMIGNHDEFYSSPNERTREYREKLPAWIRESVDWTERQLESVDLAVLEWRESYIRSGVFISHANPFVFPDWRYLNTEAEHREAAVALRERGQQIGVFGHTHRQKVVGIAEDELRMSVSHSCVIPTGDTLTLVNAGSVGQPRNSEKRSYVLRLDVNGDEADIEFVPLHYDVEKSKALIRDSRFSGVTTSKLLGFFS